MRFDYKQQILRIKCEKCGFPMLGLDEFDWSINDPTLNFCKCSTEKPYLKLVQK